MRRLDFEGCFNFRDLGGWRTDDGRTVAWNRLYRADSVHLMTDADVRRARHDLGLRTLIDLRNETEIGHGGHGALADVLVRHHAPLSSRRGRAVVDTPVATTPSDRSPDAVLAGYRGIMEASADLIVQTVSALTEDDALPAVFFCAAGKDRTGVLSAVILGALEIRDEDIVDDYVLSGEAIEPIITRFASFETSPAMYRELPPAHFAPHAETMERLLVAVYEDYGSFGEYLVSKGLEAERLGALRRCLLTG